MEFNIKLELTIDGASLGQLVSVLDLGPHKLVRPIIDDIVAQARTQESQAKAAQEPAPADVEVKEPTPLP